MRGRIAAATPQVNTAAPSVVTSGEIAGSGPVSADGLTRIDFLFRDLRSGIDPFAGRDEYRIRLHAPSYDLRVGDDIFSVSPLVESGRPLTGAALELRQDWFALGGFAAADRRDLSSGAELAGIATLRANAQNELSFNFLGRTNGDSARLWSAHAKAEFTPLARIDVEFGRQLPQTNRPVQSGLLAQISGYGSRLNYSAELIRADSAFPGALHGVESANANAGLRVLGPVHLNAQFMSAEERTPVVHGVPSARELQTRAAGISYGSLLWMGVKEAESDGNDLAGGLADTRETSATVGAQQRLGPLSLSGLVEKGTAVRRDSTPGPTVDASLSAGLQLSRGASVSLFVQRASGLRAESPVAIDRMSYGIGAKLAAIHGFTLGLNASAMRDGVPIAMTSALADGVLSYSAPSGQELSLRFRSTLTAMSRTVEQTALQIGYSMPLYAAGLGTHRGAALTSRIYDSETGTGVAGALVSVGGHIAITDRDGRVTLRNLRDSAQLLSVDLGAAGVGKVVTRRLPLEVTPAEGRTTRLDVAVMRGGRVSGRIARFDAPDDGTWNGAKSALHAAGGIAGVPITMMNGTEVRQAVPDDGGEFTLDDLQPGHWVLKADASDLPAHYYLTPDSAVVQLAAGGSGKLELDALPRRRTVRMIASGQVAVGKPPVSRVQLAPASAQPLTTAARPASDTRHHYTVTRWDTDLRAVAGFVYGDRSLWPKIWLVNRDLIAAPDALKPGVRLRIPEPGPLTETERDAGVGFLDSSGK